MLSYKEIGMIYGMSKDTVRSRIVRASLLPIGTKGSGRNIMYLYNEDEVITVMNKKPIKHRITVNNDSKFDVQLCNAFLRRP